MHNDNPATGAVAPRTNCGTTWPQVALTTVAFVFTVLLLDKGMTVESATRAVCVLVAAVLLLTSVRASVLRAVVRRLFTTSQSTAIPGVL